MQRPLLRFNNKDNKEYETYDLEDPDIARIEQDFFPDCTVTGTAGLVRVFSDAEAAEIIGEFCAALRCCHDLADASYTVINDLPVAGPDDGASCVASDAAPVRIGTPEILEPELTEEPSSVPSTVPNCCLMVLDTAAASNGQPSPVPSEAPCCCRGSSLAETTAGPQSPSRGLIRRCRLLERIFMLQKDIDCGNASDVSKNQGKITELLLIGASEDGPFGSPQHLSQAWVDFATLPDRGYSHRYSGFEPG